MKKKIKKADYLGERFDINNFGVGSAFGSLLLDGTNQVNKIIFKLSKTNITLNYKYDEKEMKNDFDELIALTYKVNKMIEINDPKDNKND